MKLDDLEDIVDEVTGVASFVSTTLPEMEGLAITPMPACRGPGGPAQSPYLAVPAIGMSARMLLALTVVLGGLLALEIGRAHV